MGVSMGAAVPIVVFDEGDAQRHVTLTPEPPGPTHCARRMEEGRHARSGRSRPMQLEIEQSVPMVVHAEDTIPGGARATA